MPFMRACELGRILCVRFLVRARKVIRLSVREPMLLTLTLMLILKVGKGFPTYVLNSILGFVALITLYNPINCACIPVLFIVDKKSCDETSSGSYAITIRCGLSS